MKKNPSDIEWWEDDDSTREKFRNGKLKWIWHSGLQIGRGVVISGVMISTMPLVVPPLVALSTVGVVLSLPFGAMYVSYTATDKLLRTLLPEPEPPPNLWFRRRGVVSEFSDGDDDDFVQAEGMVAGDGVVEKDGYDKAYDLDQREEKEWENDVRREVEARIELPKGEGGRNKEVRASSYDWLGNKGQDGGELRESGSKMVETEGYTEDIHQLGYVEEDERDLRGFTSPNIEIEEPGEEVGQYNERESRASSVREILKGITEAEVEISAMQEGVDQLLPEDSVPAAFVVSSELGGKGDSDVQEVEELVALEPEVKGVSSTRPEVEFGDVDMEVRIEQSARPELKPGDVDMEVRIEQSAGPELKPGDVDMEVRIEQSARPELIPGDVEPEEKMEQSSGTELKLGDTDPEVKTEQIVSRDVELGDVEPEMKFGDVEPEELREETTGILEAIRDEGRAEVERHKASTAAAHAREEPVGSVHETPKEVKGTEGLLSPVEAGKDHQMPEDSVRALTFAAELGGKDDSNVEGVTVGLEVITEEDITVPEVELGVVEPEESREETTGILDAIRDEGITEKESYTASTGKESSYAAYVQEPPVIASSVSKILIGLGGAEGETSSSMEKGTDHKVPKDISVHASAVAVEFGGKREELEELIGVEPEIIIEQESTLPEEKFGDVEPEELRKETTGILEAIRDEGKAEKERYTGPTEKETLDSPSVRQHGDFGDVEHMKQAVEDTGNDISVFGGGSGQVKMLVDRNERENLVASARESSQSLGNLGETSTSTIHDGAKPAVGHVMVSTGENRVVLVEESTSTSTWESIQESDQGSGAKEDLPVVQQEEQPVVESRLVVHVQKKSGDEIGSESLVEKRLVVHVQKTSGVHIASDIRAKETELSTQRESLVPTKSIDERGAAIPVEKKQESIPVEVLRDQQKIWEQINALRAIIGYKEKPKSSYMEELQALYLFTGVEPPLDFAKDGSYSRNSIVAANEKLHFLMSIIGVE